MSPVSKLLQRRHQGLHFAWVHAARRFVQDHREGAEPAAQESSQLDPLRFARGKRGSEPLQADVAESDLPQEADVLRKAAEGRRVVLRQGWPP